MGEILQITDSGLYCPVGDFYIDPWQPVGRAIVTHAHCDHARPGSRRYLATEDGAALVRLRLGADPQVDTLPYGESLDVNGARVSLHPAGHVLGSCQVRIEVAGQICVVSGDYKLAPDATCLPMEPVRCHTFVSESTFGLPIYRWPTTDEVFEDLGQWWLRNQEEGRTSVLFAYSLGKSQRILAALCDKKDPILVHGAVDSVAGVYRTASVRLPSFVRATTENARITRGRALVIAPPSAAHTPWLRKFGPISTAVASGWMQIRGMRRRRAIDRGFVISDHADWDGLLVAIKATGAERIWVTHGYVGVMVRRLRELGLEAEAIRTRFQGELDEEAAADSVATLQAEHVVDEASALLPDAASADRSTEPNRSRDKPAKPVRQRNLELFGPDD